MAIYHFSVQRISRGKGKSSVGASAYRAGEKLENERDGLVHDYRKRNDVIHSEILVPDNSPEWASNREKLWNKVESIEKRKDANTAREINVALPNELGHEQQKELVREFVQDNFTSKGMIADIAIHDKGEGNPHAHVMLPTRAITPEGFENKKVAELDKKDKTIEVWRESWAKFANQELEKAGLQERIDHRSFKDQGVEKVATIHEGYKVRAMESKGIETERGTYNRQVKEENKMLELIDRQIQTYERSLNNERTRSNGTQDRNSGVERGNIGNQEPIGAVQSQILFGRTSRHAKTNDSRTNIPIESGNGANAEIRSNDRQIEQGTRSKPEEQSRTTGEGQQSINRNNTENDRLGGEQQQEARRYAYKTNESHPDKPNELQRNHEANNGAGLRGQENSESLMDGAGEAVRNTVINNDRLDNYDTGSNPASEPFGEILKTLAKSIEKAEQAEKAKEAQKDDKASTREKTRTQRTKEKGWQHER